VAALLVAGIMFARWITSWRNFRRLLFGIACFFTLIVLVYAEKTGAAACVGKTPREWEAKGEKFSIPASSPRKSRGEEFRVTPLLKPVLDMTNGPAGVLGGIRMAWRGSTECPQICTPRAARDSPVLGHLEKGTFADCLPALSSIEQHELSADGGNGSASGSDSGGPRQI